MLIRRFAREVVTFATSLRLLVESISPPQELVIASATALLVGTVVSSHPRVVTIVFELFFSSFHVVQSKRATALSVAEAGHTTSQLHPPHVELITPLPSIVTVVQSTFTPPSTVVEAVGRE